MGQLICWSADEIPAALARVESRSKELFGDSGVFMEEYHPASPPHRGSGRCLDMPLYQGDYPLAKRLNHCVSGFRQWI